MIYDVKKENNAIKEMNEKNILTNFPNQKPILTSKTHPFIRCEPSEVVLQSKFILILYINSSKLICKY